MCNVSAGSSENNGTLEMLQFVMMSVSVCRDLNNSATLLIHPSLPFLRHVSSSIFHPVLLLLLLFFQPLPFPLTAVMSWLFLDWFVPLYLLVSVLVLAGFGACLYFLEPGLQDAHKWSNKTVRHHPLVASVNCRDDDSNALI